MESLLVPLLSINLHLTGITGRIEVLRCFPQYSLELMHAGSGSDLEFRTLKKELVHYQSEDVHEANKLQQRISSLNVLHATEWRLPFLLVLQHRWKYHTPNWTTTNTPVSQRSDQVLVTLRNGT